MVRPWAVASAPGKVILLGEHAVVYGEPSLSVALRQRLRVTVRPARAMRVNGRPLRARSDPFLAAALQGAGFWGPAAFRVNGALASGAGLGSSAALTVASTAALRALATGRRPRPEEVAKRAFEAEFRAQGAASPNDTTVATAGGGILLAPRRERGLSPLWTIARGQRRWVAHRVKVPPMALLVANAGPRASTARMVESVRRRIVRRPKLREDIRAAGALVREGLRALRRKDFVRLGDVMNQNQEILAHLGVSTRRIDRIVGWARDEPSTLGAKITGAGGGGSVLLLSSTPRRLAAKLWTRKVPVTRVEASDEGLRIEALRGAGRPAR